MPFPGKQLTKYSADIPWFHNEEALEANTFPWSLKQRNRVDLLAPDFVDWIKPVEYVNNRYQQALKRSASVSWGNEAAKPDAGNVLFEHYSFHASLARS